MVWSIDLGLVFLGVSKIWLSQVNLALCIRWIFSYNETRHYIVSCGSVWCLAAQALVIYYAYIEHSFRFDRSPTVFFAIN